CRHRSTCRLHIERLEDRTVPASYSADNVPELIAAINAANQTAEADTITLAAGATYTLTEVNNTTEGSNGLPAIAANEDLTIIGNGAIVERCVASGTPAFRLFSVAAGASLTAQNLTLQGGLEQDESTSIRPYTCGGAILNEGSLTLQGLTVQNNTAAGFY